MIPDAVWGEQPDIMPVPHWDIGELHRLQRKADVAYENMIVAWCQYRRHGDTWPESEPSRPTVRAMVVNLLGEYLTRRWAYERYAAGGSRD